MDHQADQQNWLSTAQYIEPLGAHDVRSRDLQAHVAAFPDVVHGINHYELFTHNFPRVTENYLDLTPVTGTYSMPPHLKSRLDSRPNTPVVHPTPTTSAVPKLDLSVLPTRSTSTEATASPTTPMPTAVTSGKGKFAELSIDDLLIGVEFSDELSRADASPLNTTRLPQSTVASIPVHSRPTAATCENVSVVPRPVEMTDDIRWLLDALGKK